MIHAAMALLALSLPPAQAQTPPARTPRQLIDSLGVEIRQILEDAKSDRKPIDAERAVAEQITALITSSEGHLSLTETDEQGRTPLMLAVSDGYPQVVKALLADPSVKFQINLPDRTGQTAWMVANFVPTLTLVACEPGMLTRERAQLLPPYLRRMSDLLRNDAAAVVSIIQMLETAGAQVDAETAKRVWLARCPNATPELREALASGELASTLINEAVARQLAFNNNFRDGLAKIPSRPPKDMKFTHVPDEPTDAARPPPLLRLREMRCARMPKPELPGVLNWRGEVLFKARVATRAGVVEAADLEATASSNDQPAIDYFRGTVLRALTGYQCEGDHVFEQEFQFVIR